MPSDASAAIFYIVKNNDKRGDTARGPYTMAEADSLVGIDEQVISEVRLRQIRDPQSGTQSGGVETTPAVEDMAELQARVLKEVRSWGFWLLGVGAVHLVISGFLNAAWGILLILVGLASFYFRTAAMLVIYGVTLGWAAISNLSSGQSGWMAFALFQGFLAVRVFWQFLRFRRAEAESRLASIAETPESEATVERAARIFPWVGCAFGGVSL